MTNATARLRRIAELRDKAAPGKFFTGPDQADECDCGLLQDEHFALIGRSSDGTNAIAIIMNDKYEESNRDYLLTAANIRPALWLALAELVEACDCQIFNSEILNPLEPDNTLVCIYECDAIDIKKALEAVEKAAGE